MIYENTKKKHIYFGVNTVLNRVIGYKKNQVLGGQNMITNKLGMYLIVSENI